MKTKRPKSVLRYHGGKWMLAPWIISHFPPHRIYTEVFGGGGSVLMSKPRSYAEVYNDKWDIVVNVFRILRDPEKSKQLQEQLLLTPFSRTEFVETGDIELATIKDPIEKARRTILRSFAGFGSAATNAKYATGFRANSNRGGSTPAHDWARYPNRIESFCERLKGVVIENRDYDKVLLQHDREDALHYLDPPYVHSTRCRNNANKSYAFEMTDEDHVELSKVAHELKGMVVLSGYHSDLYNNLYSDWTAVEREHFADGARKRVEVLWLNPRAVEENEKMKLFNK